MDKIASEKLEKYFSGFKKFSYQKGEIILRADDQPRGVFYLKKGYIKLYSLSQNAEELILIIFKPEDFFPIMWTINDTPNNYYLEAMTDVELYLSPKQEFLKFIEGNNDVLFELTSRILTRFGGILTRMEHAIFGNARSKVAAIILICADRFGAKVKKNIVIEVPLTHQDIAELIGLARETVSIEMEALQKKGLIEHFGKYLVVKNLQKLKNESVLESIE